jgi:phosphoribosylformylglycinamidine synthase
MKVTINVRLKKDVLDPQGKAICHALHDMGFGGVENVRQGKILELEVANDVSEEMIRQMCDQLLSNPVIEDYEIKLGTSST